MEFINLRAQYQAYKNEIDDAVHSVFDSASFIMGKEVEILERNLAAFTGSQYAISCSSGTDALLLALMALDIKPDDEVITTPFTFIATAEVIALLGAKPRFADIKEDDCNIDSNAIERLITPKTKAIIPVSLYGYCADFDEINAIAAQYNLSVIEDGCQSFGATYKGRKSCNLSDVGTTSFFPSKPLGCYGDGGALFTNDDLLAKRVKALRNHGQSARYEHSLVGINGRLDSVQAAILNVKLRHFDDELKRREVLRRRYDDALKEVSGVELLKLKGDRASVTAQYSIRVQNRGAMAAKLGERSIPTAVHYPKPLHLQKAFAALGYNRGDFPVSEKIADEIISLPFSPFLTEAEQEIVIDAVKAAVC
ncbi:MAG: DegT/DnrJ/EryC1/StrS family aminotransferase [Helicobacteraceae bacterium]|jgi:UDP-2-acetamido-2-deoxy-ribo-hexuluronate aminotransferase|nr:DegT/DnrJ/EryC1/StrS family aminotransferase [Helicobacteraceae bacterium]